MNKKGGKASILGTAQEIVERYGVRGLFLGLGSRMVWSGSIISGQFLLYDIFRSALGVTAADLQEVLSVYLVESQ